jgi:opacity protein-like surface antigen
MAASTRLTFTRTAAVIAGVVLGQAAAADDGGLYLATSYGDALRTYKRSEIDRNVNAALDGRVTVDTSKSESNKPIWSASVGYMFSPNFGIEASYLDLGKLKYRAHGSGDPSDIESLSLNFETKSHGPVLALVWALPMGNNWGVNGRIGAYHVKSTTESVLIADDDTIPTTQKATSTSLIAGVGASLILSTHLAVRLDYLYINKVKEQLLEKSFGVQLVTAGLAYVF